MQRRYWIYGALAAVALGAGVFIMTERPLTVQVVRPETDVPLRIYGLGTVEARVLSHVGFEVGGALTRLDVDAGDRVVKGQQLAALHLQNSDYRRAGELRFRGRRVHVNGGIQQSPKERGLLSRIGSGALKPGFQFDFSQGPAPRAWRSRIHGSLPVRALGIAAEPLGLDLGT